MNNTITDIFFDLDHTLWDFDKNSKLAFARLFTQYEIDVELDSFIEIYEPINLSYWKLYREEKIEKTDLRRGRLKDSFSHFGIQFSDKMLMELAVSYIDELPLDNHLFDGTREILSYLGQKYKLHIITNGFDEVQHLKLLNSGIHSHFSTVTTSEEIGVKKPNPEIFTSALNKAKIKALNGLMIGDSFEADILGAESVGMNTLFFNYRNEMVPDRYHTVQTLYEIRDYL